jgi:hypothetical protein
VSARPTVGVSHDEHDDADAAAVSHALVSGPDCCFVLLWWLPVGVAIGGLFDMVKPAYLQIPFGIDPSNGRPNARIGAPALLQPVPPPGTRVGFGCSWITKWSRRPPKSAIFQRLGAFHIAPCPPFRQIRDQLDVRFTWSGMSSTAENSARTTGCKAAKADIVQS